MKPFIISIVLLFFFNAGIAQEAPEHHEESKEKNIVALFIGSTHIIQSGINMPTFGLEYSRNIINFFAVGGIVEYEAGQHIIIKNEDGEENKITRTNSLLLIPTVYFSIHHLVVFTIGYGIEFEEKENLGLLKVGVNLEFELKNPRWIFIPNVSWDHTRHFDGIVYGFSTGYRF